MFNLQVSPPEGQVLVAEANKSLQLVGAIAIDSPAMFQEANTELQAIKSKARSLDAQRDDLVRPLNEVVRKINALFKPAIEVLGQAETQLKGSMLTYQNQEEEKAREEQRRRDEAVRLERERLQREADERERQARAEREEADRQARSREAEERRQAQELRRQGDEQAAAERERVAAEERRRAEHEASQRAAEQAAQADADRQTAEVMSAPQVVQDVPKVAGLAKSKLWSAELTSIDEVIKAAAEGNALAKSILTIDEKVLRSHARSMKASLKIPGIRVKSEDTLASRAAA